MKILVTGSEGFIAKNLRSHLAASPDIEVVLFSKEHDIAMLPEILQNVDFVFHLAGVNRTSDVMQFTVGNRDLTHALCENVAAMSRKIPIIYTSSTQALQDNPYGVSKRAAEDLLQQLAESHSIPIYIYRLPNVFGKWAKPNYNSAVATFCYNLVHGEDIQIHDANAKLNLVYIDDVIAHFCYMLENWRNEINCFLEVRPVYSTTVGEVALHLQAFSDSRENLTTSSVGVGLVRALYSTYVSYLPVEKFDYTLPIHSDPRGVFVEVLKTADSGQFSYFTAHPGITRGGHYHHSKTEKFLVMKGKARFGFRHIMTNESYEVFTSGETPMIVETIPGWAHDITNVGDTEMLVMLWANEVFDSANPDTFVAKV